MSKEQALTADNNPKELIQQALAGGADLDKLEKLLNLQERWEQNEAKKAYHKAMADFKANPPVIEKDRKVAYGTTKYNHASLANVTKKINAELSKHGLSASWAISQNGTVTVTCKITHERGYSEMTSLSASADTSGSKNPIQAIGSTITYLERYTLLALTGLATNEMEDDGRGSTDKISAEEAESILENLQAIGSDVVKFLAYMKVEKLEDIRKDDLKKAMNAIETAKKNKGKK